MSQFFDYLKDSLPAGPIEAVGDYYGGIFKALDAPADMVQTALGAGSREDFRRAMAAGGAFGNNPTVMPQAAGLALGDVWSQRLFGSQPAALPRLEAMSEPVTSGLSSLMMGAATDPTTYIGSMGAAKAPSGRVIGSNLPAWLQGTEGILQKTINEALMAPVKYPMKALNTPLPGAGLGRYFARTVVDPATDALINQPAKSVGDYLWGGPSRRAQLHLFSQSMQDMASNLMGKGHELELDIADFANAEAGKIIEPYHPATAFQKSHEALTEIQNRLSGLATTHGPEAQTLMAALSEAGQDAIAQNRGNRQGSYEAAMKIVRAADDVASKIERGGLTGVDEIYDAFSRRISAIDFLHQGRTGILADVPEQMRPRAEATWGAVSIHGKQLAKDRESIETGLQELWDITARQSGGLHQSPLGRYQEIGNLANGDEAVNAINSRLQTLGFPSITGTDKDPFTAQFAKLLKGRVAPTTANKVDDVLSRWGGAGDPLTENGYKLVFDQTVRDQAKNLGLDPASQPAVFKALDAITTAWKSMVLQSPAYIGTNALSGLVSSGLAGVNPRQIGANYIRNVGHALRGGEVQIPEIVEQNARLGREIPAGSSSATGFAQENTTLRDISGKGRDILQRIGAGPMAAGGGLLGAASGYARSQDTPEDDTLYQTLLGTGTGAAAFGTMPWLSRRLYQPLAQGTEAVLRQSAVVAGRERFLAANTPRLTGILDSAFGGTAPASVRTAVESAGGQLSRRSVDELLRAENVAPTVRRQITDQWESVLQEADDAGVGLSNTINFDYRNLTNAEEFMRQVLPFSTWATKAMPFFAARIAEHPLVGAALGRYAQESDRQKREGGLSSRFAGSTHSEDLPAVDDLWSVLTGRPMKAFFNPMRQFIPAADAQRAMSFPAPDDATIYDHVEQAAQLAGVSMHPALETALHYAGLAHDAPPSNLIRQAGPIQALTGIDLNAPGRILETNIRERILGQPKVRNPEEQATLRRIDELSIERTGQTTSSGSLEAAPFMRAKVQKSGPIWERAAQEVRRERSARSLTGFFSGGLTPTATLGPTEEAISGARAGYLIPQEDSREITVWSQREPHSVAPENIVQSVRTAAATLAQRNRPDLGGAVPPEVEAVLAQPTWRNIDRIRDMVMDAQAIETPLVRGYSGSGSAEKQGLQHALSLYQDAGAVALGDKDFAGLNPTYQQQLLHMLDQFDRYPHEMQSRILRTEPTLKILLPRVKAQKERILQENPMLAEYFQYRQNAGEQANMDDFLATRSDTRAGPIR